MAGPRFQRKRIGKILAFFKSPAGCRCLPRARWPLFSFVQSDEQKSGSKQSLSAAGNATRRVKREHTWKHSTCLRGMCWGARKRREKKGGVGCAGRFRLLFPGRFAMETFLDEARLLQRELSPDRRCFDGTRRLRTEALRSSLARCLRGCRDLRNFVAIAQLSAGMIDHSVRSAERGASGKAVGLLLSVSLPTGRQWHFRPGKTVENFVLSS